MSQDQKESRHVFLPNNFMKNTKQNTNEGIVIGVKNEYTNTAYIDDQIHKILKTCICKLIPNWSIPNRIKQDF